MGECVDVFQWMDGVIVGFGFDVGYTGAIGRFQNQQAARRQIAVQIAEDDRRLIEVFQDFKHRDDVEGLFIADGIERRVNFDDGIGNARGGAIDADRMKSKALTGRKKLAEAAAEIEQSDLFAYTPGQPLDSQDVFDVTALTFKVVAGVGFLECLDGINAHPVRETAFVPFLVQDSFMEDLSAGLTPDQNPFCILQMWNGRFAPRIGIEEAGQGLLAILPPRQFFDVGRGTVDAAVPFDEFSLLDFEHGRFPAIGADLSRGKIMDTRPWQ